MPTKDPLIEAISPKTFWFVVLRPFSGDNCRFVRGEVVDTTEWRSRSTLLEHRYIAPLPHGASLPSPDEDGRRIIDLDEDQQAIVPEKKRPVPTRKQ